MRGVEALRKQRCSARSGRRILWRNVEAEERIGRAR
jgi:hypothetical protein